MEHLRAALLRDRASDAVEEMDLPGCDPGRLERTYAQFALVNRAVAGWRGIYRSRIRPRLSTASATSLLDIGCGWGPIALTMGLMAPLGVLALLMQAALPTHHYVNYRGEALFALHFGIAMLAYSLFMVATVHALVMLAEERWLHRGVLPPFIGSLPPLLEMEALLFRILLAAFTLLTLTLVTGVFFSEQVFGKPFKANHKTIFAFVSWLIFGGLLAGHYFRGWRGKKAVRWTLAGFVALLLAYIGSKVVLEIILQRA